MVEQNIPTKPKKEEYTKWDICKIFFHFCIRSILTLVLIISAIQILYAYYSFLRYDGILSENSLKYGLIIFAGAYVALFIDHKKIKDFLKVKSVSKLELRRKSSENK